MKRQIAVFTLMFLAAATVAVAQQQQPKPAVGDHVAISRILDNQVRTIESEFVPAADAMPEDKYSFAPTNGEFKGVRTFTQQITHVAATNWMVGGAILGEKPPADIGEGENGPANLKTKADIMKYVKDSFAYAHKAAGSITDQNATEVIKTPFGGTGTRLSLATIFAWHSFDHYGQMVEYLRMNGIVPPASRPREPEKK